MSLIYTQNIPAANNDPSNDQNPMMVNTNSNYSIWNVDHIGFNAGGSVNSGWHNIIRMPVQVSDPSAVTSPSNAGQVYAKTASGDTQLFYKSSGGIVTQLTGGAAPSPGTDGYVYLDGGLILQWGTATSSGAGTPNATITFPLPGGFPNNCFNALCTTQETTTNRNFMVVYAISNTQLQATAINSSGTAQSGVNFYWVAIGN